MKKNLLFDFWIWVIILLIIWVPMFIKDYIDINDTSVNLMIYLIQALIIIYIINIIYIKPINNLNEQITLFLTGRMRQKANIDLRVANPNTKRVLKFFSMVFGSLVNIKEELLSGKAIKWEVQLATELQEKLLNKKLEKVPSLDIIAKSTPAWDIWWDSYDIIKQDDNYYIYVWDATWHWVWAWFVMVMVNALISWFSKIFKSGAQILANTNEILKPRIKSNILMTLLLVRWDEKEKRMFMTWAGHEYLMIYKQNQKKCFKIRSWWMALWMTKNIHKVLKEQEIKFEEDDIIVLYTDWITESINQTRKDWNEEMFWEQRLMESIEKAPEVTWEKYKTARSVFNSITIDLSKFMWYKYTQFDDITLAVIHYRWNKEITNDFKEEIDNDFITEWNW